VGLFKNILSVFTNNKLNLLPKRRLRKGGKRIGKFAKYYNKQKFRFNNIEEMFTLEDTPENYENNEYQDIEVGLLVGENRDY
jgi:hypothetical protein